MSLSLQQLYQTLLMTGLRIFLNLHFQILFHHEGGINVGDVAIQILNVITLSSLNLDMEPETTPRSFKRIKLYNHSNDTMRVNLLTNVFWKEDQYNDIMDIRIPPKQFSRLMVPLGAEYNVYFRDSAEGQDEMITINTSKRRRIGLTPGMTLKGEK